MRLHSSIEIVSIAALLSAGVLTACSDSSNQTAGQKLDQSVAMAQQKGNEIQSDVKQGAGELKDQASAMAADAKQTIGDAAISAAVNARLAKDPALSVMKVDVDTVQGRVTLSGTAPDAAAQARATQLARSVDGVTGVDNRLVVK